jgi:2-dehydropantoate 2-reductase
MSEGDASPFPFPFSRIAVVGSGAVGCYYGGRLAEHGREVHFLMRSDLAAVREHGLKIRSDLVGDVHLRPVHAHGSTGEIGPVDLVIIAIKATSNDVLEDLIPPLLHEKTALLTLQNGLGNEEFLAERFGAERLMGGLCFVCLNRTAPGEIRHIDHGLVSLGEFSGEPRDRTRALHQEWLRCRVPCQLEQDLTAGRWKKLMWNVPFNGLAIASGGKDVAQILADPELYGRARALMEEIRDGAAGIGISIDAEFADKMISNSRSMGAYRPSSMIDFEAGREVEIDAIWAEPLRQATAAGKKLPELARLLGEIRARCGSVPQGD